MVNSMEYLSDEYIRRQVAVRDASIQTTPHISDYETENCTGSEEIPSIPVSGLEREDEVRIFDTRLVPFLQ